MPTHLSRSRPFAAPLFAGLLLLSALALSLATSAEAKLTRTIPADLRVVSADGKTLAEHTQYTTEGVRMRTDRNADCLGADTGGSGRKVTVPGFTALGQLADGRRTDRDLRPLSISDHFDFGLSLCGIGGVVAPSTGFWSLRVNHGFASAGADQTKLKRGDELLWYLVDDWNLPSPAELALRAPKRVKKGEPTEVTVFAYDDAGKRSRVAGAKVRGAAELTDARGKTTVTPSGRLLKLRARAAGAIPSPLVTLCTAPARKCPPGYARTIGGTKKGERIRGSRLADTIRAGAGADRINAAQGNARDLIDCGPGRDAVKIKRGSRPRLRSCERVVRVRRR